MFPISIIFFFKIYFLTYYLCVICIINENLLQYTLLLVEINLSNRSKLMLGKILKVIY